MVFRTSCMNGDTDIVIFMLLIIWHSGKVVGMVTLILQNGCTVLGVFIFILVVIGHFE